MTFEVVAGSYVIRGERRAVFHWRGWGTHTGALDPLNNSRPPAAVGKSRALTSTSTATDA